MIGKKVLYVGDRSQQLQSEIEFLDAKLQDVEVIFWDHESLNQQSITIGSVIEYLPLRLIWFSSQN